MPLGDIKATAKRAAKDKVAETVRQKIGGAGDGNASDVVEQVVGAVKQKISGAESGTADNVMENVVGAVKQKIGSRRT